MSIFNGKKVFTKEIQFSEESSLVFLAQAIKFFFFEKTLPLAQAGKDKSYGDFIVLDISQVLADIKYHCRKHLIISRIV